MSLSDLHELSELSMYIYIFLSHFDNTVMAVSNALYGTSHFRNCVPNSPKSVLYLFESFVCRV